MSTEIVLTIDEKEDEAHRYYLNAHENWRSFIRVALEIKSSGEWKQKAASWGKYCDVYMPVKASRIRQLKGADETALLIESVTEVTPNESQIRLLNSVVPKEDSHMKPVVYKLANDLSDGKPSRRHYKAAYETELELSITGAVSVDGKTLPPTSQARIAAHQEAIIEADMRFKQHKQGNTPSQKIEGVIRLVRDKHGVCYPAIVLDNIALKMVNKVVAVYLPVEEELEEEAA